MWRGGILLEYIRTSNKSNLCMNKLNWLRLSTFFITSSRLLEQCTPIHTHIVTWQFVEVVVSSEEKKEPLSKHRSTRDSWYLQEGTSENILTSSAIVMKIKYVYVASNNDHVSWFNYDVLDQICMLFGFWDFAWNCLFI